MGKLFRRDTLKRENKINDAVTSSDCRVLKYKSVLSLPTLSKLAEMYGTVQPHSLMVKLELLQV